MYPEIGGAISTYSIALIVAVVGSALAGAAGLRQYGFSTRDCVRIQCVLAVTGLLGAKLYSLIERGGWQQPLLQELGNGYRYPGAVIGLIVVLALLGRRFGSGSLSVVGDAIAPSIGVGAALLRVGCFLHGCCFGVPSRLPWAVRFPADSLAWHAHVGAGWIGPASLASVPVHPLQLYFAVASLVAAFTAWQIQRHRRFRGQVLLTFLAVDGIGKVALENLRAEPVAGVQGASMMIGLLALFGLLLMGLHYRLIAQPASQSDASPSRAGTTAVAGLPSRVKVSVAELSSPR